LEQYEVTKIGLSDLFSGEIPEPSKATNKRQRVMLFESQATRMLGLSGKNNQYTDDVLLVSMGPDKLKETKEEVAAREKRAEQVIQYGANIRNGKLVPGTEQDKDSDYIYQSYHGTGGNVVMRLIKREAYNRVMEEEAKFAESIGLDTSRNYWKNFLPEGYVEKNVKEERRIEDALSKPWTPTISYGRELMKDANFAVVNLSGADSEGKSLNFADGVAIVDSRFLPRGTAQSRVALGGKMSAMSTSEMTSFKRRMAETLGRIEIDENGRERFYVPGVDGVGEIDITDVNGIFDSTGIKNKQAYTRNGQTLANDEFNRVFTRIAQRYDLASVADFQDYDHASERIGAQMAQFFKLPQEIRSKQLEQLSEIMDSVLTEEGQIENVFKPRAAEGDPFAQKVVAGETQLLATARGRNEVNNYLLSKLKRAASGELIDPEKTGEISDAKIRPFLLDSIIRTADAKGKKPNLSYFAKKFNMTEDEVKNFLTLRGGEVFDFDYLDSDSISMARSPYNYGEGVSARNRAKEILSKYGDLSTEEGIKAAKRAFEKDFGQSAEGIMVSFEDSKKLGGSDYDGDEVKRAIGRLGKVMADSFLSPDDVVQFSDPKVQSTLTQEEFDKLTPAQRTARAITASIHFTRGVGTPDAIGKRFAWLGSAADDVAKKAALQSAVAYGLNSTSVKDAIAAGNTDEMWKLLREYGKPVQTIFSDISDAFNVDGLSENDTIEVNGRALNKKYIENLQIDKMLPVSAMNDSGLLAHMFQVMSYGSPAAASLSADIEDIFTAYDQVNPAKQGAVGRYQEFKRNFLKGELIGKYGITPESVLQQAESLTQEAIDEIAKETGKLEFSTNSERDRYLQETFRSLGIRSGAKDSDIRHDFATQMRLYGPTAQVLTRQFGQEADTIIQGLTTQGTKVLEEAAVKYNNRELPEVKIKIDQPKTETKSQDKQEERTKAASTKQEQSNGTYTRNADRFVDELVANDHKSSSKADQLPSERIQDTKPQQQTPPSPPSPPNNPPSPPSPPNNPPSPPSPPSPPNNPPSDLERLLSSVTMGQTVALQTDLNDYLNQLHDVEGKIRSKTFKTEHPDFQSNVWDYYDRTINESFEVKKREFLQRGASQKDLELLQNERNEIANAYNYGLRVSAVGDIESFRKELEDDLISSSMLKGDNNYLKQTEAMNKRLDRATQAYTKLREKVYGTDDDSLRGKELRLKAGFITQDDIDALETAETHLKSLNEQIEKNDSFNQKNRDIQNRGDILSRISESNQLDAIYNVGSYRERYNASIDQRVQEAGIKRDRYIQNEVAAGRMTEAEGQAYREQHSDEQLRKAIDHQSKMQNVNAAIEPFMSRISRSITSFVMSSFSKMFQSARQFIKQFDSEMNQIQMISLKTNEEMEPIRAQTIDKAIGLRTSVSNVAGVEAALYRQGLSDNEVASRTDDIIKFATVTGTKVESATKIITTALQNDLVSSAQEAMDALTALGDSAATTAEEIAKGMQKSAASAKVAGVSYAELTSMLTVITSKTQLSGQMAGTALQTIFNRMHKVTTTKMTQDTNGETTSLNDVESALSLAGVTLREDNETFRNTTDVLRDLSKVWQDLNDIQKSNVITAMAGTRQSNMFSTLMEGMSEDNGEEFDRLLGLASNSEGVTQSKYEIAVTSLNASVETLKSTFDGLVESFTMNGFAQGAVDFVTSIVAGFTAMSEQGNGAVVVLETILSLLSGIIAQVAVFNTLKTVGSIAAIPGLGPILALLAGIGVAGGALALSGSLDGLFSNGQNLSEIDTSKNQVASLNKIAQERNAKIDEAKNNIDKLYKESNGGIDLNSESALEAQNNIEQLIALIPSLKNEINDAGEAFKDWDTYSAKVNEHIQNAKQNSAEIAAVFGVRASSEEYGKYLENLRKYETLNENYFENGTYGAGFLDDVITYGGYASDIQNLTANHKLPQIFEKVMQEEWQNGYSGADFQKFLRERIAVQNGEMFDENGNALPSAFSYETAQEYTKRLSELNKKYGFDYLKMASLYFDDANIQDADIPEIIEMSSKMARTLSGHVDENGRTKSEEIFNDAMRIIGSGGHVEGEETLQSLVDMFFALDTGTNSARYGEYGITDWDSLRNYSPKNKNYPSYNKIIADLYEDISSNDMIARLRDYSKSVKNYQASATEDFVRTIMTNDSYLGSLVSTYAGNDQGVINALISEFVQSHKNMKPEDITATVIRDWLLGERQVNDNGEVIFSGEYKDANGHPQTSIYSAKEEDVAKNFNTNIYLKRKDLKPENFAYSWVTNDKAILGFDSYKADDIQTAIDEQREVLAKLQKEEIEALDKNAQDYESSQEAVNAKYAEMNSDLDQIEKDLDSYDENAATNNIYKNTATGVRIKQNQTTAEMMESLYGTLKDKDIGYEKQYRMINGYLRQAGDINALYDSMGGSAFPNLTGFMENDKTLNIMLESIRRGEDVYSLDTVRDYIENKLYGGSIRSIVAEVAKSGYTSSQGYYNLNRAEQGDQTAKRAIASALGIDYQTYLGNDNGATWNANYRQSLEQTQRNTEEQIRQVAADFFGADDFNEIVEAGDIPVVDYNKLDELYDEIEQQEKALQEEEKTLKTMSEAENNQLVFSSFGNENLGMPKMQQIGVKTVDTEDMIERTQKNINNKRKEIDLKRKEAQIYAQESQQKLIEYVTQQAVSAKKDQSEIDKAIKNATNDKGKFNAQTFYEELDITPVEQEDVDKLNEQLKGSGYTASLVSGEGLNISYNEANYNPFLQYQNAQKQYTSQDISSLMGRAMRTGLSWDTLMENASTFGFSVEDVQQLMNTDVYKYLSLDESQRGSQYGQNLKRSIDLSVSGISELEEAGKVAEGTLRKIDALKKGGQIALTARLQIQAEGFELDQTLARLNNGTDAERLQTIMNLTGATEQQVLTNRDYWEAEAQAVANGRIEQRRAELEQEINNATGEERYRLIDAARMEGFDVNRLDYSAMSVNAPETFTVGTTARVGAGNVLRTSAYTNANPFFLSDEIYSAAMNMLGGNFDWKNNPELEAAVQSSGYTNLNSVMTMRDKGEQIPEWMMRGAYSELYSARIQELANRGVVNNNVPGIMQGLLSGSQETRDQSRNELLSSLYNASEAARNLELLEGLGTETNWATQSSTYLNALGSIYNWNDQQKQRFSRRGNLTELRQYVGEQTMRANNTFNQLFETAGLKINTRDTTASLTARLIEARSSDRRNPIYDSLLGMLGTNGVTVENGQIKVNDNAGQAATAAAIRLSALNSAANKVYQTQDLSKLQQMRTRMSVARPSGENIDEWMVSSGLFGSVEEYNAFVERNAEVGTKIGEYMAGTAEFSEVLEAMKNAQISIEVSGLSELEQAGKIAEGTSQAIENLKKGGSFAIKAQIDLETNAFNQSQNIAKWLSGDETFQKEAAVAAGFSDLQWQNDREGVTALMNSYIDNMRQTAVSTVQAYIDQGEMSTAQNLADMLGVNITGPDASEASFKEWNKSGTTMTYYDWLQRKRMATLGEAPSQVYEEDPVQQQIEQLRKQWNSTSAETRNSAMRNVVSAARSLAENQYYRDQANTGNWSTEVVQGVASQLGLNVRDVNRAVASGQTGNILTMLNAQEAADIEAMNTQLAGMGEKIKAQLQLGQDSSININKTNINDFADKLDDETRAAIQEAVDAGIDVSITTSADGVVTIDMSGIKTTFEGYEYNPEEGFGSFGNIAQRIYSENTLIGKSNGLASLIGGAESAGDILTAIAQGGKIGDLYELINAAGGIDALMYSDMIRSADENGTLSQLNNEGLEQYLRNTILSQSTFSGATNAYELTDEEKAAIVSSFFGSSFAGNETDYRDFLPENYQRETPEMQQALENEARQQWTQSRWLGYNYNAMASIAGQDLANAGAMAIMSGAINPFTNEQQQFINWRTQNAMNGVSGLTADQQFQFTNRMFDWMRSGTLNENIQKNGGWNGTVAQNMFGGDSSIQAYAQEVSKLEDIGIKLPDLGEFGDNLAHLQELASGPEAGEYAEQWTAVEEAFKKAGVDLTKFINVQKNANTSMRTSKSLMDKYGKSASYVQNFLSQLKSGGADAARAVGQMNTNMQKLSYYNEQLGSIKEGTKGSQLTQKQREAILSTGVTDEEALKGADENQLKDYLKQAQTVIDEQWGTEVAKPLVESINEAFMNLSQEEQLKYKAKIDTEVEVNDGNLNLQQLADIVANFDESLAEALRKYDGAGGTLSAEIMEDPLTIGYLLNYINSGAGRRGGGYKKGGGGGGGKSATDKKLEEVQHGLYVSEHEARMAELNLGWQQKYGSTTSNYAALERQKKAQQDLAKSYLDAAKKLKEQLKSVKEGSEDYYKLLKAIQEYLEKAEQASQKAREVFFQMQEIARKSKEWQQALEHHDVSILDIQLQRQQKTGTGEEQRQTLLEKQQQEAEELERMREKLALYEKQYQKLSGEEKDSEYGRELLQKILQAREEIASFGAQQDETALQIQATTRAIREQAIQLAGFKTSLADAKIQTAGQSASLNEMNELYRRGITSQREAAGAQLQYIETLKQQLAETRYGTAAYAELLALLNQAQIAYEQARQAIDNYTKAIRDNKVALKQYVADKQTSDVNEIGATRQRYDSRVSTSKREKLLKDEMKQKEQAISANNEVIAMYETGMAKGEYGKKNSPEYQQALATVRQMKATNAQYATDIDLAKYELIQIHEDKYQGELDKKQYDTEGANYVLSLYETRASTADKQNMIAEIMERRQEEITERNKLIGTKIQEQSGYEYGSQEWYASQDEIDELRKANAEAYDENMKNAIKMRDYQYSDLGNKKDQADFGYSLVSSLRKFFADEITMKDTNAIIAEEIGARNDKISANADMISYLKARMASGEAAVGSDDFNKWMKELQSLEQESINLQAENKSAAEEMFHNAEKDLGYDISTEQYDATMVQKFVARYQQRASSNVVESMLNWNIRENNDLIAVYNEGIRMSEAYLAKFGQGTEEYQTTLKKIQDYKQKIFDLETQNMDLEKKIMDNQLIELQRMAQFLQHQLSMLAYQESLYQNRGELTNVNIVLSAENKIRNKQLTNISQQRKKMESQLSTMATDSAEYEELRLKILQLDEQEVKLRTDIEATTKKMKENEVQVKKYRTAVENIVRSEIEARIQKRKQMRDAEISLENEVLKAFKKAYQDRWDIYKKDLEKQKENLEKQKELIDENLNARRNADDMAEKYAELAQLRYQLSMIETDASRTKDAKELRKKIEDLEKDINWTRAENEAELEKSAIDTQIEGIEDTISEGDQDVQDYLANDNNFAAEVASVMSLQREDIVRWLEAHDETFANSLAATQDKMAETWTDTTKQWYGIVDTHLEEITQILRSSQSFMNYMKDSDTYLNGSSADKFINEYDWSEAYRLMVDSQKNDATINLGQDYNGGVSSAGIISDLQNTYLSRYKTKYRFDMDYFDSIVDEYGLDLMLSQISSDGKVKMTLPDNLWDEISNHLEYLQAFDNTNSAKIDIIKDSTAEEDIAAIKKKLESMDVYWKYSYVYGGTEFSSNYSYNSEKSAEKAAKEDAEKMYKAALKMIEADKDMSAAEKDQATKDAAAAYAAALNSIEVNKQWFIPGTSSLIHPENNNPMIKFFTLKNGKIDYELVRATDADLARYNAGQYGYQFSYDGEDHLSQANYSKKDYAISAATEEIERLYNDKISAIDKKYAEDVAKINASSKSDEKKKKAIEELGDQLNKDKNAARIARDKAVNKITTYNKDSIGPELRQDLKLVANGGTTLSTTLAGKPLSASSVTTTEDALDAFTKSIADWIGDQYVVPDANINLGSSGSGSSGTVSSPGGKSIGSLQIAGGWSLLDDPAFKDALKQHEYGGPDLGSLIPESPISLINSSAFTNNGFNIQSMTVAITEASFTDDQDYQALAKRVGEEFARELSKRGFNMANYSF
jgi:hypothetical protein